LEPELVVHLLLGLLVSQELLALQVTLVLPEKQQVRLGLQALLE
jgi:hypothetical protein